MTIILCAINDETGEVLNRDGSVAGKVVPPNTTPAMVDAYLSANHLYWQAQDCIPRPADKWCNGTPSGATAQSYKAMLAASRVDLSGCEVKEKASPLTAWMDNVLAARLGKVALAAGARTDGMAESVDFGLRLRRLLEESGFEIRAILDQMPKEKAK